MFSCSLRSLTTTIFRAQCLAKDLDAAIKREDPNDTEIDALARSMPPVFQGLELTVDSLEAWASIYDSSPEHMFVEAGEEIPIRCSE